MNNIARQNEKEKKRKKVIILAYTGAIGLYDRNILTL